MKHATRQEMTDLAKDMVAPVIKELQASVVKLNDELVNFYDEFEILRKNVTRKAAEKDVSGLRKEIASEIGKLQKDAALRKSSIKRLRDQVSADRRINEKNKEAIIAEKSETIEAISKSVLSVTNQVIDMAASVKKIEGAKNGE